MLNLGLWDQISDLNKTSPTPILLTYPYLRQKDEFLYVKGRMLDFSYSVCRRHSFNTLTTVFSCWDAFLCCVGSRRLHDQTSGLCWKDITNGLSHFCYTWLSLPNVCVDIHKNETKQQNNRQGSCGVNPAADWLGCQWHLGRYCHYWDVEEGAQGSPRFLASLLLMWDRKAGASSSYRPGAWLCFIIHSCGNKEGLDAHQQVDG